MSITIEVDDRDVLDALGELIARVENPRPMLMEIGEELTSSTKLRFQSGTGPDGEKWAANSSVTLEIYSGMFADAPTGKKPLVGETGRLGGEIAWQLIDDNAVEIGSNLPYAAMQQFGGMKAQWPHLWGDIPARPYLGLSNDDKATILQIVADYLTPAA